MIELRQAQVLEITGVKGETLQAWIKRGLVRFAKAGTGHHRSYDFPALAHVAIMVAATDQGLRASDAAGLATAAVPSLVATMIPKAGSEIASSGGAVGPLGYGVVGYAAGSIRIGGWADGKHAPHAFLAINVAAIARSLSAAIVALGQPAPDPVEFTSSLWGRAPY